MSAGNLVLFGTDVLDLDQLCSQLYGFFWDLQVTGSVRAEGPRLLVTVEGTSVHVDHCLDTLPDWYAQWRREQTTGWMQ